jgi:hypothetical protein
MSVHPCRASPLLSSGAVSSTRFRRAIQTHVSEGPLVSLILTAKERRD